MSTPGAYIDLKNVDFFFRDGHRNTGAVDLLAGYSIGATTLVVDGITGIIPAGVVLQFANHDTEYFVTAATGTPNTEGITITPALTAAVADDVAISFGGRSLEIKVGEGNLTWTETQNLEYKKDRQKLDQVRLGEETELSVSMGFAWIYLKSATGAANPTPYEVLKQKGLASTWESSGQDCEPYAIDVVIINRGNPETCGSLVEPVERITFPAFRRTSISPDLSAGQVSVEGSCNVLEPIYDRLEY